MMHPATATQTGATPPTRSTAETARGPAPRALPPRIASELSELRADVTLAARLIAPVWPLDRFIAINPLGGLQDQPFASAVKVAGDAFGARGTLQGQAYRAAHRNGRISDADLRAALRERLGVALDGEVALERHRVAFDELLRLDLVAGPLEPAPERTFATLVEAKDADLAAQLDAAASKWCAAFFGGDTPGWSSPDAQRGLFGLWRAHAASDRALPRHARRMLRELPAAADLALRDALRALGVGPAIQRDYLQAHLSALPGWAGHVRWRAEHQGGVDLTEYLAMRVTLEAALLHGAADGIDPASLAQRPSANGRGSVLTIDRVIAVSAAIGVTRQLTVDEHHDIRAVVELLPADERRFVWQRAYELDYQRSLLGRLSRRAADDAPSTRPAAQVVCCIDTRSEGLRRHLEAVGPYETLGFAGFFGVAIEYQDLAAGESVDLCPALIRPKNTVREVPQDGAGDQAERYLRRRRAAAALQHGYHVAKQDAAAPFALAEAGGWFAGPRAAAKTFAAGHYGKLAGRLAQSADRVVPTAITVDEGFSPEQQAMTAEVALRTMGLVDGFAPLVVFCGHGSHTDNNPYAAALDCGACGGQSGAPNARTAAAILNSQAVREQLRGRGIDIPQDTVFLAAEHETTADEVRLLDLHLLTEEQAAAARALQDDLDRAGAQLSAERCQMLPGAPKGGDGERAARHVRTRGNDWAQVFPEWGLVGNAAFVVAPRAATKHLDLGRRVFLHSYDPAADPDATGLETILTAPLVVAQWINAQYLFSSVDPEIFGAGTKTVHNVVGGIGVLSGPGGDLRRGLPWQSVGDGEGLVHEPMRLLAAVQAPRETVAAIVARNPGLRQLVDHEWITLVARDDEATPWTRLLGGAWHALDSTIPTTNQETAR